MDSPVVSSFLWANSTARRHLFFASIREGREGGDDKCLFCLTVLLSKRIPQDGLNRVTQQASYRGWVGLDFDFGCSHVRRRLLGLMGDRQNGLSSLARWVEHQNHYHIGGRILLSKLGSAYFPGCNSTTGVDNGFQYCQYPPSYMIMANFPN